MFDAPEISVIIPTYNRAGLLAQTIPALRDQTGPMRYEVIWIDDGSSDATAEVLRDATAHAPALFRYIQLERSGGPSQPRNVGIEQARSPIVLTLDDDIIADRDFVRRHWEFHQLHNDETIGAVGELYLAREESLHPMALFAAFPYHELRRGETLDFLHFWAGNMSLKRSFMLRYGMYRVDRDLTLLEDMECGYRMMQHGFRLLFLPAARARHMVSPMTPKAVAAKGYHTGRAQQRLLQLVPEVVVMKRFGVLSRELGAAAYLQRLARRALFLAVDNRLTARLLVALGARANRRSACSDFYYRLIFRRNMIAGYRDALKQRPALSSDLVAESRI